MYFYLLHGENDPVTKARTICVRLQQFPCDAEESLGDKHWDCTSHLRLFNVNGLNVHLQKETIKAREERLLIIQNNLLCIM